MKRTKRFGLGTLFIVLIMCLLMGGMTTAASDQQLKGWQTVEGKKYYYQNDGTKAKGWQTIGKYKYYFNKKGEMVTGWQTLKKKTYYFNKKGQMQKGWENIGKYTYYFDKNGIMKTGWQKIGKYTYYFNSKGKMLTGWRTIKKKTYYFNKKGRMKTGWLKLDGKKYYMNEDGVRQTGYLEIGDKTYYFKPKTGVMDPKKTVVKSKLEKLCESVVSKQVKTSDSNSTKLNKLFKYVVNNYTYLRNSAPSGQHWYRDYAYNMLNSKKGNCYGFAAVFACLAKEATGLDVRVATGYVPAVSGGVTPHGWCEVKINGGWKVFDPDLYKYDGPYNVYYNYPITSMHSVGAYYTVSFN